MPEYNNRRDPKNRCFALSYAKDIEVASIEKGDPHGAIWVLKLAEVFRQYLDNELNNIQALGEDDNPS